MLHLKPSQFLTSLHPLCMCLPYFLLYSLKIFHHTHTHSHIHTYINLKEKSSGSAQSTDTALAA